ncbi:MAG TPA: hypothetical protein VKR79_09600 [Gaiellaceae bacterium]|nr:hypothetical protein [Gaiellaceae bacterium]
MVVVLGMHRSGTTAFVGTLQAAGLYLGNVRRRDPETREVPAINRLHEAILERSGGSWRAPPTSVEWTDQHRDLRDRIGRSFDRAQLWGFKDPRTVLLLDFWREAFGDSLVPVGIFREPRAVVASLLNRDGAEEDEWFGVWKHYNAALLREHESSPFPLVEFAADGDRFHEQLVLVLRRLGLRVSAKPGFFDPRRAGGHPTTVGQPPPDVGDIYTQLRARAVGSI